MLNEGLTYSAQGSSNENTVSLSLTNLISGQYQYIVLAGSGVATVRVEGNFTKGTCTTRIVSNNDYIIK